MKAIRVASGDHPIDLGQCAAAERLLRAIPDGPDVIGVPVESSRDPALLVERLAWALSQGQADGAICCAACLAVGLPQGVEVAAIFSAGDPRYQCVSLEKTSLDDQAPGSNIVAWDAVSRAQILHRYRSLNVEIAESWADLFEGLRHSRWAAGCLPPQVVQAAPQWGLVYTPIPPEAVMPAIGQGIQVVLSLEGEKPPPIAALNEEETECQLRVESAFWWQAMEDCGTVATASASCRGEEAEVRGMIAEADGAWLVSDTLTVSAEEAEAGAQTLAETCKSLSRKNEVGKAS